jgi:hypothetical protein
MENKNLITNIFIIILLILLTIAGIISYQGIEWNVLKDIESKKLILPTPIPKTPISTESSATISSSLQK